MRFTFAAATATLLGCLLSSGICVATPISARRDLSSIPQEISHRSPTELIAPRREAGAAHIQVEFSSETAGKVKLEGAAIAHAESSVQLLFKAAQKDGKIAKDTTIAYFKNTQFTPMIASKTIGGKNVFFTWTHDGVEAHGFVRLDVAEDPIGMLFSKDRTPLFNTEGSTGVKKSDHERWGKLDGVGWRS